MPESDRTVKCPICDEVFDPTVAGGWCTNPDCGEWQHTDAAAADVDTDDAAEVDADAAAADVDTDDAAEVDADAAAAEGDAKDATADVDTDDEGPDDDLPPEGTDGATPSVEGSDEADTAAGDAVDDGGDDEAAVDEASDTGAGESVAESDDDTDDPVEAAGDSSDADAATITCPDCDRELEADANFCVDCGADVQDVTPGDDGPLEACPSCDTAVDDDASFCVNCGENLDAHRSGTAASTPDSASDSSTAGESAAAGNAVDTLASQATDDAAVPDKLVLSVEGRDITVEDGDRVGREIRAALLDAGRPEDEAVRIHREHVRFDRQPEGYYLVDLGDNPTALNETPLKKGDREPVQPGDELELSGVVTVTIRAA